jgi:hypothetical protein
LSYGDVVAPLEAAALAVGRLDAALAYAVEPRSWAVQPDPAQRDLRDRGLAHLRRAGAGQPALIGAALGLRDCIGQDGSRATTRAALPFYLQERGITRQVLALIWRTDEQNYHRQGPTTTSAQIDNDYALHY